MLDCQHCICHVHLLIQAAEGEEVPEELANLVRKPNSDSTTKSNPSYDSSSRVGEDEELSRLKFLLEEEQAKNRKMEKELEEMKKKMAELSRRFQDATRAYEQEKRVR